MQSKRAIVVPGLILLGLIMVVLGVINRIPPPIITGLGFFLIAWAWPTRPNSPDQSS